MKILIDADACPSVKLIEEVAKEYNLIVNIYFDTTHNIESRYSNLIMVDKKSQSADIKLVNDIQKGDIIITDDYGVAIISLSKEAKVINSKGNVYTNNNINTLLLNRHINSKLRKHGIRVKGPKKRNKLDDENLIKVLKKLIEN